MHPAAILSRYWPFANGSGRVLDKFAKGIDLGSGERVALTSDGFRMRVYADDLIGRHILLSGKFDRSVVQVLLDQARNGDVLLDIGANIGYYSAVFLAQIPNSRVICVEPQPGIVDLLWANVEQFGARAEVKQIALSDSAEELRFHVNTDNRGASRVAPDGEITVPAIEAAELLRSLPRLDLVKIDVEGHEEPILRSMEGQLKRLSPRAILFEDQTGGAAGEIGAILTRLRYRIYGIDKRLLRTALVEVQPQMELRFNDYIALA